tara:strand:+ start:1863 stop:2813 length:951 start_codon:yes stop_codon:yes gene_type:complete
MATKKSPTKGRIAFTNGGTGRMICAIRPWERFIESNPENRVITNSTLDIIWGNRLLQSKTYHADTKGIFENVIKDREWIESEPYCDWEYYNQKLSIGQAFDKHWNGTYSEDPEDYRPKLYLGNDDIAYGKAIIDAAEGEHGNEKTVIVQPWGRGATNEEAVGSVIDKTSRSFDYDFYMELVKELRSEYNVVCMSEFKAPGDSWSITPKDISIRQWFAAIAQCDYFIGCDSLGQHVAYAFDVPGTVVLGSTFAENITYPHYFNIVQKKDFVPMFDTFRLSGFGSFEAANYNAGCMRFDEEETEEIIANIIQDIEDKS